jgi:rhodanese-related sulfurtransferase
MINITIGAISCSALLLTAYIILFRKKKFPDYRNNEKLTRLISQTNFDFLLIDIRSDKDYFDYHIPTSINIPFKELISSLPVENMFLTIIVYGDSKKKSLEAAEFLRENGYFNVTSYGSVSRWKGDLIMNQNIGDIHIENSGKGRFDLSI